MDQVAYFEVIYISCSISNYDMLTYRISSLPCHSVPCWIIHQTKKLDTVVCINPRESKAGEG